MAFKPPWHKHIPKIIATKKPEFADLIVSLTSSDQQTKDNPLYQTIYLLLERLTILKNLIISDIKGLGVLFDSFKNATFLTQDNETLLLPNSRRLLRSLGILFDDTIPGERTITLSHYWTPLTDGNEPETNLIYANGESIAVNVPNIAAFP